MNQPQSRSGAVETGYFIEFTPGWWAKKGEGPATRHPMSGQVYHGSVTKEQVDQLTKIVHDFLNGKSAPSAVRSQEPIAWAEYDREGQLIGVTHVKPDGFWPNKPLYLAPDSSDPIKAVTVTASDGSPVAAPCAISGCQYAAPAERALEGIESMREVIATHFDADPPYTSPSSVMAPIPGVELLKAVDALTVEQADELAAWAEQQVAIDQKMPQSLHRKLFQGRFRRFAAAAKIAREYLRARRDASNSANRSITAEKLLDELVSRARVRAELGSGNEVWGVIVEWLEAHRVMVRADRGDA